jgi:hypothetical protein
MKTLDPDRFSAKTLDLKLSVADPNVYPGSRTRRISILDPNFPSRIRIKEIKYFNPKNGF